MAGPRILVTRKADEGCPLVSRLQEAGCEVQAAPLIDIAPIPFNAPALTDYDWLFFTSQNGVRSFFSTPAVQTQAKAANVSIAVVGPATARAVSALGFPAAFVPTGFDAETAAREFNERYERQRVLWPCGNLARSTLKDRLNAAGHQVSPLEVYRTTRCTDLPEGISLDSLEVVAFCSPSAVEGYLSLRPADAVPIIACIGPETAEAARQLLGRADIVAEVHTLPGLADAILHYLYPAKEEL